MVESIRSRSDDARIHPLRSKALSFNKSKAMIQVVVERSQNVPSLRSPQVVGAILPPPPIDMTLYKRTV